MKAVDEIEPDLRDLVENMTKMSNLPDDYEGKEKIANWYVHSRLFLLHICLIVRK